MSQATSRTRRSALLGMAAQGALLLSAPDSGLALAPPGRYVIETNGTNILSDDTLLDRRTRLIWQRGVSPEGYGFADATAYCAELELGGKKGFRIPTRAELVSLVDYSVDSPAIDTTAFPEEGGSTLWTSTPRATDPSQYWTVDFKFGDSGFAVFPIDEVRCVRSAS